jgi:hypothetical protein
MDPDMDLDMDPAMDPDMDPAMDTDMDPAMDPGMDPDPAPGYLLNMHFLNFSFFFIPRSPYTVLF